MRFGFFKIKIALLFVLLFQNQSLIGNEIPQCEQVKCYISKNNIAICDEGIAILGAESLIVAESLFHDEYGFYFLDSGAKWKCNWCGEFTPLGQNTCQACGKPYGSRKKR
jgi:hypothetical protein